ncbi:unnamed protein product [Mucor hiemalis]
MINRSLQLPPPYHRTHQQKQHQFEPTKYCLAVRQQPQKARLCSFKDKVDRRPLDPPPIVQLFQSSTMSFNDYHKSAKFFLHTTLAHVSDNSDIHCANGNRTTAGSVVQSLHKLKDTNEAGAFFIFADISIRVEGIFRLKFTLFEIKGMEVERVCSVFSDPFQVYSPKSFPGMSESTALTRTFSDQGVRIRIRKEAKSVTVTPSMKRRRGMDQHESEIYSSSSASTTPKEETHYLGSTSPINSVNNVMSMQNLLIAEPTTTSSPVHESLLFSNRTILPLPQPTPQQQPRRSLTPPHAIRALISSEQLEPGSGQGHYFYSIGSSDQQRLPSLLRPSSSASTTSDTHHHYHRHHSYNNEYPSS